MTDRELLLAAIKANPREDTPRLAYADYLDEHGGGDADAATVEFIRLSCPVVTKYKTKTRPDYESRMPRECYPWIAANWRRLLPEMSAYIPARDLPRLNGYVISGRFVFTSIHIGAWQVGVNRGSGQLDFLVYGACWEFWKGFLRKLWFNYQQFEVADKLFEMVKKNQPLATYKRLRESIIPLAIQEDIETLWVLDHLDEIE